MSGQNIAQTGVFLTDAEMGEVNRLARDSMSIRFEGPLIIQERDIRPAQEHVQLLAAEKGLPPLPDGATYGLSPNRELCFKVTLPVRPKAGQ